MYVPMVFALWLPLGLHKTIHNNLLDTLCLYIFTPLHEHFLHTLSYNLQTTLKSDELTTFISETYINYIFFYYYLALFHFS